VAEELSRYVALGEGLMLEWCSFLGGVDRRLDEVVTLLQMMVRLEGEVKPSLGPWESL
jgi:hypothetical protein